MKNDIQSFDDYLFQKMTRAEKIAFEERLSRDAELSAEFQAYKELVEAIREDGRRELRQRITAMLAARKKTGGFGRQFWTYFKKAGAIAAFFAFCLSGYFWYSQKPSPQQLFEKYYVPYPIPGITRGVQKNQPGWKLFQQAYLQRDYEKAVALLPEDLSSITGVQPHLLLAAGCALMSRGDYLRALEYFRMPAVANNDFTSEQSLWYQALCLLQLGEIAACRDFLTPLAKNSNADHYMEARYLRKQIRRLL